MLFLLVAFSTIATERRAESQGPQSRAPEAGKSAAEHEGDAHRLVELLGHQTYQSRSRARRELIQRGPSEAVRSALATGLRSNSLEIRQASWQLLQQFEWQEFDRELERLTSPDVSPDDIRLTGWREFSAIAGDDQWSRRLYGRIVRGHHATVRKLIRNRNADCQRRWDDDPYRLATSDAVGWALLLFSDSMEIAPSRPDLSASILNALNHSGLGPLRVSAGDRLVIQRLVDNWLSIHPRAGNERDRLMVAMRYECNLQAGQLCRQTLADESATAAALVTAMLCGCVLHHDDLGPHLSRRLNDDRTAHIWQLIASRKTKIRTQVRDVALALLLHQEGIDPRQFGFVELQADPLLLFRDHSLGFADERSRQAAHEKGRARLGI